MHSFFSLSLGIHTRLEDSEKIEFAYENCGLFLFIYEGQSNENRTPATKWQWNLFYSKVITIRVNTFIPLRDETINFRLVERGRSLMDPQPHLLLHFLVRLKPTSTNVFFQVAKNVEVQGERSGLYGGYWSVFQPNLLSLSLTRLAVWGRALSCKRMIPSDTIPGRFDFIAYSSSLCHQETNHTSLLFFTCIHFQCWTNTLYTTLTSRSIKKQLCGPSRFHYAFLPSYRWQYRYVKTVLPDFARNVFYGRCWVFIWLSLVIRQNENLNCVWWSKHVNVFVLSLTIAAAAVVVVVVVVDLGFTTLLTSQVI